jgi:hypothetical protein
MNTRGLESTWESGEPPAQTWRFAHYMTGVRRPVWSANGCGIGRDIPQPGSGARFGGGLLALQPLES